MSPLDRDTLLHSCVTAGGAALLAYASYVWRTGHAPRQQARGLAACGVGFLLSAAASIYLRAAPLLGPALSLAGCAATLAGTRMVLRDRQLRHAASRRGK